MRIAVVLFPLVLLASACAKIPSQNFDLPVYGIVRTEAGAPIPGVRLYADSGGGPDYIGGRPYYLARVDSARTDSAGVYRFLLKEGGRKGTYQVCGVWPAGFRTSGEWCKPVYYRAMDGQVFPDTVNFTFR